MSHGDPSSSAPVCHDLDPVPPPHQLHHRTRDLFERLRSRLDAEERQSTIQQARNAFDDLIHAQRRSHLDPDSVELVLSVIEQGPNDSRRVVLQCLSDRFTQVAKHDDGGLLLDSAQQRVLISSLVTCVNVCLRKSRTSIRAAPASQLSPSALRTAASALKALHALLNALDRGPGQTGSPVKLLDHAAIMDTLLLSIYFGLVDASAPLEPVSRARGQLGSHPNRSPALGLRMGALSFQTDTSRASSSSRFPARSLPTTLASSPSPLGSANAPMDGVSSVSGYDTDASTVGGFSESEAESVLSDAAARNSESEGSSAAPSVRAKSELKGSADGEEQRKRTTAARGIRQNSLHCLTALNRLCPRELYSHWPSLFPDGSETTIQRSHHPAPSDVRTSPYASPCPHPSLFTVIRSDPSVSVKLAAIESMASLLTGGQAYLGIAQQRAGKLPAFTSLSAKNAALIVDLRASLLQCLQDAAQGPPSVVVAHATPKTSIELVAALLRLTKVFATSTARAKLLVSNAEILQPAVLSLCSHTDSNVVVLAYEAMALLAANSTATVATRSSLERGPKAAAGNAAIVSALITKLETSRDARAETIQAWRTLAICVSPQGETITQSNVVRSVALCEDTLSRTNDSQTGSDERIVVAEYVTALVSGLAAQPSTNTDASLPLLAEAHSDRSWESPRRRIRDLLDRLCDDPLAAVRRTVASAMPAWLHLERTSHRTDIHGESKQSLLLIQTLAQDPDEGVRAEATRALGHILSTKWPQQTDDKSGDAELHDCLLWDLEGAGRLLLGDTQDGTRGAASDGSGAVRQQASWTLANWTESLLVSISAAVKAGADGVERQRRLWRRLALATLELVEDEPAVAVGSLRACGFLLAIRGVELSRMTTATASAVSAPEGEGNDELDALTLDMLDEICSVLEAGPVCGTGEGGRQQTKSPKMRWNAANALVRTVKSRSLMGWLCAASVEARAVRLSRMLAALCDSLDSKVFKVKIAAAEALVALTLSEVVETDRVESWRDPGEPDAGGGSTWAQLSDEARGMVRGRVDAASAGLEGAIERASFKEASLYGQECRRLFGRVREAYGLEAMG